MEEHAIFQLNVLSPEIVDTDQFAIKDIVNATRDMNVIAQICKALTENSYKK
jgi:hypothetical protein